MMEHFQVKALAYCSDRNSPAIMSRMPAVNLLQIGRSCGEERGVKEKTRPLGAVRVSFGVTSVQRDVERLTKMLCACAGIF